VEKCAQYGIPDIAKPAVRWGRKATGLYEIAGLPGRRRLGFLFLAAFHQKGGIGMSKSNKLIVAMVMAFFAMLVVNPTLGKPPPNPPRNPS